MKALSLWQPWATLWCKGLKLNETRRRGLSHRGLLVVHAAMRWTDAQLELCSTPAFREVLAPLAGLPASCAESDYLRALDRILPRGGLIGQVHISDCMKITDAVRRQVTGRELAFGDYSAGRFAIVANEHMHWPEKLPWRGQQGLFEVPAADIAGHLSALIERGHS